MIIIIIIIIIIMMIINKLTDKHYFDDIASNSTHAKEERINRNILIASLECTNQKLRDSCFSVT